MGLWNQKRVGPIVYIYFKLLNSALHSLTMHINPIDSWIVCYTLCNVWNYETKVVLNSNLMIPDFPHIIKIRLAPLFFCLLCLDLANLIFKDFFIKIRTKHSSVLLCTVNVRIFMNTSLWYEESLVSSNLNSKLFWFHSAHPNQHTVLHHSCQLEIFAEII